MDEQADLEAESQGAEMLPIATEVLTVTEQLPGRYVSLLNDDFFAERGVRDPTKKIKAMLLLGRNKLMEEIGRTDRSKVVETAVHKNFRSSVFSVSFLLDSDMNLVFLTYFGEQTPRDTNYAEALVHVLEVLDILENDLGGDRSPLNRSFGGSKIPRSRSKALS